MKYETKRRVPRPLSYLIIHTSLCARFDFGYTWVCMVNRIFFCISLLVLLSVSLLGCSERGNYLESFVEDNVWDVSGHAYVSAVIDPAEDVQHLALTVDFPQTFFWSTAGRNDLLTGSYAVSGTPLSGDDEVAYGLAFYASGDAEQFYYFMVSGDGYYSIGECTGACETTDKLEDTGERASITVEEIPSNDPDLELTTNWIQSGAINTGVGATNILRVDTPDPEIGRTTVSFYINDKRIDHESLADIGIDVPETGDIGIVMQTFASAATVAFDDLSFTNYTE